MFTGKSPHEIKRTIIATAIMLTLLLVALFAAVSLDSNSSNTVNAANKTVVAEAQKATTTLSITTKTSVTTSTPTKVTTKKTTTKKSTTTTTTVTTAESTVSEEDIIIEETVAEEDTNGEYCEENVIIPSDYCNNFEDGYVFSSNYEKGSYDYILLCNCVAYEYGAYWVEPYEQAKVAEVIINRVNSGNYPDNIPDVISQPNQFSGYTRYFELDTYSEKVTQSIQSAVDWYLEEGYISHNHNYFGFYGDGYRNYFS